MLIVRCASRIDSDFGCKSSSKCHKRGRKVNGSRCSFITSSFTHAILFRKINPDTWESSEWKKMVESRGRNNKSFRRSWAFSFPPLLPFRNTKSERDLFKKWKFMGICWYIYLERSWEASESLSLSHRLFPPYILNRAYLQLCTASDEISRVKNDRTIFPLRLWFAHREK